MFKIQHITVDCREPYALAEFWSAVTGWPVSDRDEPGDPEVAVEPTESGVPELLFVRVPELKQNKNRIHLDLVPRTLTRDEEVARLLGIGAKLVDDRRGDSGRGWVVLADPEGNEFCVEAERAQ